MLLKNREETIELGKKIGKLLQKNDVILLKGDLGAGKTTFVKGIALALGVKGVVNSPTFTIVKEYKGTKLNLYHLDLYRLNGIGNDFDLEEYYYLDGVTCVEWPLQVEELIPEEYLEITIKYVDLDQREIVLKEVGPRYEGRFIDKIC